MDLRRITAIFEERLSDIAGRADPEGAGTECDAVAAFEQGLDFATQDSSLNSLVYNKQCASFPVDFVDEYVAAQTP